MKGLMKSKRISVRRISAAAPKLDELLDSAKVVKTPNLTSFQSSKIKDFQYPGFRLHKRKRIQNIKQGRPASYGNLKKASNI